MKPTRLFRRGTCWIVLLTTAGILGGCRPAESEKPGESAEQEPAQPPSAGQPAEQPQTASKPAAESEPDKQAVEPAEAPATAITIEAPRGLPPVPVPADNPMTQEKVELGKMLYFDKRLSKDGAVSCATCHDPQMAWAEHKSVSEGIGGQFGQRNSPTVLNAAYAESQFWDGRAKTLEGQALGPIENPVEMGHELPAMVRKLSELEGYKKRFQEVFGTEVTEEGVAKAIAAFERTILSGNAPYDRFKDGEEDTLTEAQKRGLTLFEENCAACHVPPHFSNYRFYNAGIGMDREKPDEGRKKATGREHDLGKFRVPPLREVEKTPPYFHDGSTATLEKAVAIMAAGGKDNPKLSAQMKAVREAELTPEDQKDLVEFLKTLSGEYPIVQPPTLP